jgi:hypothetical protein
MRERAAALVGSAPPRRWRSAPSIRSACACLRTKGNGSALKPNFSILDSDDVLGVLKDAGGTTDNALARRWQWADRRLEEPRASTPPAPSPTSPPAASRATSAAPPMPWWRRA